METQSFTPEELSQPITLERINEYHVGVGEDFADQQTIGSPLVFAGFLLAKHPDKAEIIMEIVNDPQSRPPLGMQCLQEVFEGAISEQDSDTFYTAYAEYINHTTHSKAEVNKVLLSKKRHYKY